MKTDAMLDLLTRAHSELVVTIDGVLWARGFIKDPSEGSSVEAGRELLRAKRAVEAARSAILAVDEALAAEPT